VLLLPAALAEAAKADLPTAVLNVPATLAAPAEDPMNVEFAAVLAAPAL